MIWISNLQDLLDFRGKGTYSYQRKSFILFVQNVRWKPSSVGSISTDMIVVVGL